MSAFTRTLVAALAAGLASAAANATTTTVVDVPTRGVLQRFLYVHPDAPVANIVALGGGDGVFGIWRTER